MKRIALALALVLAATPAFAYRWQQKHIDVVNCASGDWTEAITNAIVQWNACKVVTLSVVSGSCPGSPNYIGGKYAIFSCDDLDCTLDTVGNTQRTNDGNTILQAFTAIYNRAGFDWTPEERRYVVAHEMGHAIAGLPHVLGVTASVMSPSIVNPIVQPDDCAALRSRYKGR